MVLCPRIRVRAPAILTLLKERPKPSSAAHGDSDCCCRLELTRERPGLSVAYRPFLDGQEERISDVVLETAAIHLDEIDPALLRAGRLDEKISLPEPSAACAEQFIGHWLAERGVALGQGLEARQIVQMVPSRTIANVESALQAAVNRGDLARPD